MKDIPIGNGFKIDNKAMLEFPKNLSEPAYNSRLPGSQWESGVT